MDDNLSIGQSRTSLFELFKKYSESPDPKALQSAIARVVTAQPPEYVHSLVQEFNKSVGSPKSRKFPYLELRPCFQKDTGTSWQTEKLQSVDLHLVYRPAISAVMKIPASRFRETQFYRNELISERLTVSRHLADFGIEQMQLNLKRILSNINTEKSNLHAC